MLNYINEIKNRVLLLIIVLVSTLAISYLYKEILLLLILQYKNIDEINHVFYFIFTDVSEIFLVYLSF